MNTQSPTSPDGKPIRVRPIRRSELGRVVLRCLPDGGKIETLFKDQGAIGFAAWAGRECVGLLHGYAIEIPGKPNRNWPARRVFQAM